jgi:hypothetical protein
MPETKREKEGKKVMQIFFIGKKERKKERNFRI